MPKAGEASGATYVLDQGGPDPAGSLPDTGIWPNSVSLEHAPDGDDSRSRWF